MRPKALSGSIAKYSRGLALSVLTLIGASQAPGATLTWDNVAGGAINDGGGAWLTAGLWNDGTPSQNWVSGSDAIFGNGGTGGFVTLASPGTTVGSLTFNSFTGTYTLGTAGQAITLNAGITINSTAAAVTIISPITLGGSQSWTNGSASTFTVSGAITGGANTLTLNGTGNGLTTLTGGLTFTGAGGLIIGKSGTNGTTISGGTITLGGTGGITINSGASAVSLGAATISANQNWANSSSNALTTAGILAINSQLSLTAGTVTFGNFTNTGTGGVVINGGTAQAGNNAAFGTGTLTLTSGTLRSGSTTARSFANNVTINGSVTLGDVANNGALTFSSATQSVSNPATITALSAVNFGTAFTWSGNAITYAGRGLVTQTSTVSAATNTGNITIGDGTTFSGNSVGGNVSVAAQTGLGSGSYTINYGGTLTTSVAFNPTNAITVNNGGTLNLFAAANTTPSGLITFNSGARLISNTGGSTNLVLGSNVSFPTAGALDLIAAERSTVASTYLIAYPAFTGTLAIGGWGFGSANTGVLTTTGNTTVNGNKTLALNHLMPGGLFFGGLSLNGNLTVAGGGIELCDWLDSHEHQYHAY
jgi:hypothetical protein